MGTASRASATAAAAGRRRRGRRRRRRRGRHSGALLEDRGHRSDRLRHAVLEDLEVGLLQIPDEHPVLVPDDDVDEDGA